MKYVCAKCGDMWKHVDTLRCSNCGNVYELVYEYGEEFFRHTNEPVCHWKYREFMPIKWKNIDIISMGEGGTPLIPSRLEPNLLFKCEYVNPSGSFKDRASALEVTLAQDKDEIVVATTGNMGSSLAAYAAYVGLRCKVFMPRTIYEDIHSAKIKHMEICGAKIHSIDGDYTVAMIAAEQYSSEHSNSQLCGDYGIRIEGTKSIGFEIADQLGWSTPEYIVVPIGNGTLLYAIHKAFKDLCGIGILNKIPKIIGVRAIDPSSTIASAIACPTMSLDYLAKQVSERIITVTDNEIMRARTDLAAQGMYVEPGGAAAYAGYGKLRLNGIVVVLLTGSGLKGT